MLNQKYFDENDRRRHIRIDEPLPARMRLLKAEKMPVPSEWMECNVRNISCGGLRVLAEENNEKTMIKYLWDPKSVFQFEITLLPSQDRTIACGIVYYVKKMSSSPLDDRAGNMLEFGVGFSEISIHDEKLITEYVKYKYLEKYGKNHA